MKGINRRGNVQKSFITNLDEYEEVAKKAQSEGIAISDVLRTGMHWYLEGKLTVEETWTGHRKRARKGERTT